MQVDIVCTARHRDATGRPTSSRPTQIRRPPARKRVPRAPPQHGRDPTAHEAVCEVAAEGDHGDGLAVIQLPWYSYRRAEYAGTHPADRRRGDRDRVVAIVEPTADETAADVGAPAVAEDEAAVEDKPVAIETHAIAAE